jgi:hypothetical protein
MTVSEDNINTLLPLLKARLRSSSHTLTKDTNGNNIYVACEIFSNDVLAQFLFLSLMNFNQVPHFTFYSFADSDVIAQFGEVLVEGATIYALASQALIERGREFAINDGSVSFYPPSVAEMLNTQYSSLLEHHWTKLRLIKEHIKEFQNKS